MGEVSIHDLSQLVMRRCLFHLIALQGGQFSMNAGEFDACEGMSVAVTVDKGRFIFKLTTPERLKELGDITEV